MYLSAVNWPYHALTADCPAGRPGLEIVTWSPANRGNLAGATLLFQHLPYALRDHGGIVVAGKRHGALESMRSRNEDAKPAIKRVGGNPCFMRGRSRVCRP
jgi:hypothetical protein